MPELPEQIYSMVDQENGICCSITKLQENAFDLNIDLATALWSTDPIHAFNN